MRTTIIIAFALALPSLAYAAIVPSLDLRELTVDADTIIVGAVLAVDESRETTVDLESGVAVPARAVVARMSIDQVLKGSTANSIIEVRFEDPEPAVGYGDVVEGELYVAFLREHDDAYRFVSPYWPAVRAVPGARGSGTDAMSRVLTLLVDSLRTSTRRDVTIQTLYAIRGIDSPIAIEGLKLLSNDSDPEIRLTAINYLLWINQVEALSMAEAALSNVDLVDARLLNNVRSGIANGLRNEAAIPGLQRLLQYPEPETRRAAAAALSRIMSPEIIRPLKLALNDSDFQVRLSAVRGLAKVSGQSLLFPSDDAFRDDEQRFIVPLGTLDAAQYETQ